MTELMSRLCRPSRAMALAMSTEEMPTDDDLPIECGWYESSWDLAHGLSVRELPASERALYGFAGMTAGLRSAAPLQ